MGCGGGVGDGKDIGRIGLRQQGIIILLSWRPD